MNRGPKRQSADEKQAKGTFNSTRDKPQHLIIQFSAPIMPGYLPAAAQSIWHEEMDRVVLAGIGHLDSSFYASYCALEAIVRAKIVAGQEPATNTLTELRRRQEVLGIAGPSSRALRGTAPGEPANPFADLPEA